MIEKFSSISTKKLPKALSVISRKNMVSISDYGDFYKMAKRNIMLAILGFNAQVQISTVLNLVLVVSGYKSHSVN
jgi:ent-kaurene oxidase